MRTLLLRLAAPLQSWGSDAKFEARTTGREPTKSGVIGMLAAALGIGRDGDLGELRSLSFGVRIDREGELLRDYHTVYSPTEKKSFVTERYYLSDAVFLAGLSSQEDGLLERLEHALRNPVYPLFLGRRSCPPTLPLVLGVREGGLLESLEQEAFLAEGGRAQREIIYDDGSADAASRRQDLPISFSQRHRRYGYRKVSAKRVGIPSEKGLGGTEHDPMSQL